MLKVMLPFESFFELSLMAEVPVVIRFSDPKGGAGSVLL
jgi:hypothetical protein